MGKRLKIVVEAIGPPIPFIKNKEEAKAEQTGKNIEQKAPFFA